MKKYNYNASVRKKLNYFSKNLIQFLYQSIKPREINITRNCYAPVHGALTIITKVQNEAYTNHNFFVNTYYLTVIFYYSFIQEAASARPIEKL